MSASTNCIFCKLVRGEIPSVKVHEDAQTLTFMDVRPASPGHALVISKAHASNLLEITETDLLAVTLAAQRIARAIQKALAPDGMRVNQFNGVAAGQTVFHYHVHIIPIQEGQRIGAHGRDQADTQQLEALAAQIRAALGS